MPNPARNSNVFKYRRPIELNIKNKQRYQLRQLGKLLPNELNATEFVMRLIRLRIQKGIADGDLEEI